ncbi:hypothetical protein VE02_06810 [Pseudogymnoascus sp. 03VT05]|nr:hypothetical protein VE02_06810 [Pseudogymnoascus sp. 03VT05]
MVHLSMLRSIIFLLMGAAVILALETKPGECDSSDALVSCLSAMTDCTAAPTIECACNAKKFEFDCYSTVCPDYKIPTRFKIGYESSCGGTYIRPSGAGMLSVSTGGLLTGVAGAVALVWL